MPDRHTVGRLAELGVRRISTGSLLFRTALRATLAVAESVRTGRQPSAGPGTEAGVPGYAEVQRMAVEG
ncbi:isocitrate lyase/phosphoenolpyruvate mutase family protein [Streptomyces halobius]|uniref:isocitrate lyase/phosphoenolpyruvate mutase family protein n=1 Tax=Streptomyces halobius TaxID=2879846 RepID=UPI00200C2C98|nr:isocitrate lyase/phosphoenolpyruvate mutase family protein [Streptomyces halobius]